LTTLINNSLDTILYIVNISYYDLITNNYMICFFFLHQIWINLHGDFETTEQVNISSQLEFSVLHKLGIKVQSFLLRDVSLLKYS